MSLRYRRYDETSQSCSTYDRVTCARSNTLSGNYTDPKPTRCLFSDFFAAFPRCHAFATSHWPVQAFSLSHIDPHHIRVIFVCWIGRQVFFSHSWRSINSDAPHFPSRLILTLFGNLQGPSSSCTYVNVHNEVPSLYWSERFSFSSVWVPSDEFDVQKNR